MSADMLYTSKIPMFKLNESFLIVLFIYIFLIKIINEVMYGVYIIKLLLILVNH